MLLVGREPSLFELEEVDVNDDRRLQRMTRLPS
jgi:hypothetical protein